MNVLCIMFIKLFYSVVLCMIYFCIYIIHSLCGSIMFKKNNNNKKKFLKKFLWGFLPNLFKKY